MGVDPPLATQMLYSQCSTSRSVLQSHRFLGMHFHLKNNRWILDRIAYLLMSLEHDHY